ncbi:hypothetical protein PQR53_33155 [Paraburkholderia fungorum]|uniref:hypothetical protein n=1 Tax=Paraburkholderia fungorum TaxID=134537 RepID=UPI0038B7D17A
MPIRPVLKPSSHRRVPDAARQSNLPIFATALVVFLLITVLFELFTFHVSGLHFWSLFDSRDRSITMHQWSELGGSYQTLGTLYSALTLVAVVVALSVQSRQLDHSMYELHKSFESEKLGRYLSMLDNAYFGRPFAGTETFRSVNDVRKWMRDSCKDENGFFVKTKYEALLTSTTDGTSPAHDYANQIGLELQRLGFQIMYGAVPLAPVLAVNAPVILEDWSYCNRHVEYVNRKEKIWIKDGDNEYKVAFGRRHGEWLSLMAMTYMQQRLSGELCDSLLSRFENVESAESKAKQILASERSMMAVGELAEDL